MVAAAALTLSSNAIAAGDGSMTAKATQHVRHWFQVGEASWYGLHFQGRKTATGERFDMNALTCAHRTLPLGSWLRVTNLRNSRSVIVRVNDRGPMEHSRIVDLSYAAAQSVSLNGTARVQLEPLNPSDPAVVEALLAQVHIPMFPTLPR